MDFIFSATNSDNGYLKNIVKSYKKYYNYQFKHNYLFKLKLGNIISLQNS